MTSAPPAPRSPSVSGSGKSRWRSFVPSGLWGWAALAYILFTILVPFLPDPKIASRLYQINMIIMLHMVLALGLNIVIGWIGLLDLGYVGFVLIGVYTTVILSAMATMDFEIRSPAAGEYRRVDAAGESTANIEGEKVSREQVLGTVHEPGSGAVHEVSFGHTGRLTTLVATPGEVAKGDVLAVLHGSIPFAFVIILAIASLHTLVWGLLRGIPVLRLRDDYFAIVTFAVAEIIFTVVKNEVWLTRGPQGYPSYYPPGLGLFDLRQDSAALYFFVAAMVVLVTIAMIRLAGSRVGRAWFAIRADETSAQSSGIAVTRYKMLAFALSALIAGFGGSLMGFQYHVISTNQFDFWLSVIVLCCIVLGGMGSIRGVLVGAVVLMGLGEILRDVLPQMGIDQRARMLFYGIVMIGIMIFRARGLHPPSIRPEAFSDEDAVRIASEPGDLYAIAASPEDGATSGAAEEAS